MTQTPIEYTCPFAGRVPTLREFRRIVYRHYRECGRDMPWRRTTDPYSVLVSEIMLQQTSVERVRGKYEEFLVAFPDFDALCQASLREVLRCWQGLGYNRRAVALARIAEAVVKQFGGELPRSPSVLVTFPGIGKATAGAICAFAYNLPTVFVETNIRRVFLHCFFPDRDELADSEIIPLVEETLDTDDPRTWYYALMDYGAMLKRTMSNPNRRSSRYRRQAPFEGSDRQTRGMVLRALVDGPLSEGALLELLGDRPGDVRGLLDALSREGLVGREGDVYLVPG